VQGYTQIKIKKCRGTSTLSATGAIKRRKENYALAGCLFAILFLIWGGWLLSPVVGPAFTESQNMLSLQKRGIGASGCIIERNSREGQRGNPVLTYFFQTPSGVFQGQIEVNRQFFDQSQLGQCFPIVYLADNPAVNSASSFVEAFDPSAYWSTYTRLGVFTVAGLFLLVVAVLASYFRRRKYAAPD
jgi:hypothetical protein